MRRHPTSEELATWMHGGPDDPIGPHIDDCPRCADACAELLSDSGTLGDAIQQSLTADPALEDRVMHGVESSLVARSVGETFIGLLGLGVETTKIILGEDQS